MVLLVELVNSAVEAVVDRIGTDDNPLSGRAKDLGSAAVFASLVLVAVIWGAVAWGRFLA
jgi:diacylglycerol kinase (ATP)